MKANELMIGDWVIIDDVETLNDYYQVVKIDSVKNTAVVANGKGNITSEERLDNLLPIPLTPERLKDNGFRQEHMYFIYRISEYQWLEYYPHEHRLTKWSRMKDEWNNHSIDNDMVFLFRCSNIHELQHAMRRCGIDKEIIL